MIAVLAALGLVLGTWAMLRGGFVLPGARGVQVVGFDPGALGLGALAVAVAVYLYGWDYGLALVGAVALHEFGHVAAYRVCGHDDARFRLIPILGGVAISNRVPARQDRAVFIALMGPAICLAPMALAFAVADAVSDSNPAVAGPLYSLGIVLGFFNFFNLLPFWPLDGGRVVQLLAQTYLPGATRKVSIAMTVIGATLAVLTQAWIVLFFILISWGALMQSERLLAVQRPMTKGQGLLALGAYGATMAAFFVGGGFLVLGIV